MVRKANLEDIELISFIISTVWQDAYKGIINENFLKERTTDNIINKVKNAFNDRNYYIFEEENIIKGIISGINIDNINCEIIQLYVRTEFQGNNIGTKLLDYMKMYYKSKGCKNMNIWTLKNARNNAFYVKNGGIIFEEKELEIGKNKYPGIGYKIKL